MRCAAESGKSRFSMIAVGKNAIADHLNVIPENVYLIADHLKAIADGFIRSGMGQK